ncbi:MAG: YqaJ viral recombinase family protein [Gammaproteobacteria bacterium]|nr:YqaJ viral recombinase family protein [Gammaproteobacteria bacterium]
MIKVIPDNNEHWHQLRAKVLTSTEISALFNLSPYSTEYELWHRKKTQEIVTIEQHERMQWGNRLEAAIAEGVGEDQSWEVEPFKEFIYNEHLKIGSSFDYRITKPFKAILEIKNVDSLVFRNSWDEDEGELESAPHIEIQAQHQMLISGIDRLFIAALVGGNTIHLIERERDAEIHGAIIEKSMKFWESIEANKPPKPDYERDAAFIASLYSKSNEGSVMEGTPDIDALVASHKIATENEKQYALEKSAIKAQLLEIIKDSEKVKSDKYSISLGMVKETQVSFTRKGFRNFRIFHKKQKEANNV